MTPERWRQIRDVFDAALCVASADRPALIDQSCGGDEALRAEVVSLLACHQQPATLLAHGPLAVNPLAPEDDAATSRPSGEGATEAAAEPTHIGPYRIERRIGRGGMGTVYGAVRADQAYHQEVAVKLLRPGLDSEQLIQRFRIERQILATLDHPNITKLLDGGATEDGRPYLVMEQVLGTPIDAYCANHQLSIRDRVALFRKVCDAVQLAHQSLVVHRDLKPSNILVTDAGEPKLLDFGIAKLLQPAAFPQAVLETVPGVLPMTPAYASPEQVGGEPVGTASDIYALGIVLYELLTGRRPYAVATLDGADLLAAVREQVPVRPSQASGARVDLAGHPDRPTDEGTDRMDLPALGHQLRGDLDNIVLMALRKDPQRRYASAERLSDDLRCFLTHRPVSARPDQWSYRASKLVRRNRVAVALTASVFATLLLLVAALAWQRRAILDERDRARELASVVVDMFELPDPARNRGLSVTAKELLDQAVVSIDGRFAKQPAFRADLAHTIGRTFKGLGLYLEAEERFDQAWRLRYDLAGGAADADLSLIQLAHVKALAGDYAASESMARQALTGTLASHGGDHASVVAARFRLAHALTLQGRYDEAEVGYRQAIATARQLDLRLPLAELLRHFGILLRERAQYDEGEQVLEEAIMNFEQTASEAHPGYALATNNLGVLLLERGEPSRAQALLEKAVALQRRLFDEPHPELATALNNLGRAARAQGNYARADALLAEALDVLGARYGAEGHPHYATTLSNLADLRADQGATEEADALYQQVLEQRRRLLGPAHPAVAESLNNLARIVLKRGDLDAARARYEEALEISRRAFGTDHPQAAAILTNLGQLALRQPDADRAAEHFEEALGILRATLGDQHPRSIAPRVGLADVLRHEGRLREAAAILQQALDIASAAASQGPDVAAVQVKLAQVRIAAGHHEQAEPLLRDALIFYEANMPADHLWIAATRFQLATCLFEQGKMAAAEPLLQTTFERLRADFDLKAKTTRDMLGKLIQANEALGRDDRAATYRALLEQSSKAR